MSQTLTKPILLDRTGQEIKNTLASDFNYTYEYKRDALDDMADVLGQDWLLTYEDVHSEMDDHVASIADSLVAIKDILNMQGRKAIGIITVSPPTKTTQFTGAKLDLSGVTICARMSNGIDTVLADVTEFCTFSPAQNSIIPDNVETLTVTASYNPDGAITAFTTTFTITVDTSLKIVDWSTGTDAEVSAMLDAHYQGKIDIHEFWSVGDERIIHLSVPTYENDDFSYTAYEQDVAFVLTNEGGKELVTPVNGMSECAYQVDQKVILSRSYNPHFATKEEDRSSVDYYGDCGLRNIFCNDVYKRAFPNSISGIFKKFKLVTTNCQTQPDSVHVTTEDWFAIRSCAEYTPDWDFSTSSETTMNLLKTEGELCEYYETSANRMINNGYNIWTRTCQNYDVWDYMYQGQAKFTSGASQNMRMGIAPFGVI